MHFWQKISRNRCCFSFFFCWPNLRTVELSKTNRSLNRPIKTWISSGFDSELLKCFWTLFFLVVFIRRFGYRWLRHCFNCFMFTRVANRLGLLPSLFLSLSLSWSVDVRRWFVCESLGILCGDFSLTNTNTDTTTIADCLNDSYLRKLN